jgi:hypothetical protein
MAAAFDGYRSIRRAYRKMEPGARRCRGGHSLKLAPAGQMRRCSGYAQGIQTSIAVAIAGQLPALRPWLPPKRRIWESEHYCMAIFEAAALAMTHFAARRMARETHGNGGS